MASDWPLLTGGRYPEVAVRSGLTVVIIGIGILVLVLFFGLILSVLSCAFSLLTHFSLVF
jgi:hypothetical protein